MYVDGSVRIHIPNAFRISWAACIVNEAEGFGEIARYLIWIVAADSTDGQEHFFIRIGPVDATTQACGKVHGDGAIRQRRRVGI